MTEMCLNAIGFTVEFLKLFLVTEVFFRIKQCKNIYLSFMLAMLALVFGSTVFKLSDLSFLYGMVSIILLSGNACEKRKCGLIVLAFLGISIVDMIFSVICINAFHLNEQEMIQEGLLDLGINSISLVILVGISIVVYKKKPGVGAIEIKSYLPVYIVGAVALSLYLTSLQFIGMEINFSRYRTGLMIGLSLRSLVLIILCVLLVVNKKENENLRRIDNMNQNLLESQKEYYLMLLLISNSYSGEILRKNENLISTKSEYGHGYGIKNVKKCIEETGGRFSFHYTEEYFNVEAVILHVA